MLILLPIHAFRKIVVYVYFRWKSTLTLFGWNAVNVIVHLSVKLSILEVSISNCVLTLKNHWIGAWQGQGPISTIVFYIYMFFDPKYILNICTVNI